MTNTALHPTAPDRLERNVDFRPFDCDNHYYEAEDAFTRHLDPRLGPRVIQWCQIGKRRYHVIGGVVNHAVTNPTFDPVSPAGAMAEYFRGNPSGKARHEHLGRPEPIRPEYRDRDARLRTMDEQGLSKIWLFPTLGMMYEQALVNDPEAVALLFGAFNRWLEEDWGFDYQDRIFAGPYISLCDVDWACRELEWALDRGARTVVMRPAPVHTRAGVVPPADTQFDKFWARVNESGVTVVAHAGDSGYSLQGYGPDSFSADFQQEFRPHLGLLHIVLERPIFDFLGSIMVDRIFERFPNIRLASVENGSGFLPDLCQQLRSAASKYPGLFQSDPVELMRRNVWINPFWEDDVGETVSILGEDHVMFGSDWPHIEGMPRPLDYLSELDGLTENVRRKVLLDNVSGLNVRRPTSLG
jgi:predicted TIM-barrel fold metal-dependent hydrolase